LNILYGGLGISKLQFLIKKIKTFLVIKTLDPDPDSLEMPDPYPDLDSFNPVARSGSTTLSKGMKRTS
jgi:hypothetical protein